MKTGDLAKRAGVRAETVLFYEKAGLLPSPSRTHSNYRQYDQTHLARLTFIRRARDLGFDLQSVKKLLLLADDQTQSCETIDKIASLQLDEVERKISALTSLKLELKSLVGQCKSGRVSNCKVIEALSFT